MGGKEKSNWSWVLPILFPWSSPLPLVTAPLAAHWCMQMPPERLIQTLGLKGAGILHWGPSNRWEMTFPQDVYVSSGSHEFVHHVHVWKLHLHLSHHDGRHDDVQVVDKYFSIWRLNLYLSGPWRLCSQWNKLSRVLRLEPMGLVWTSSVRSWCSSWATWPMSPWQCTSVTQWVFSPPMPLTGSPSLIPFREQRWWLGDWAWGSYSYPTIGAFSLFSCFVMPV